MVLEEGLILLQVLVFFVLVPLSRILFFLVLPRHATLVMLATMARLALVALAAPAAPPAPAASPVDKVNKIFNLFNIWANPGLNTAIHFSYNICQSIHLSDVAKCF